MENSAAAMIQRFRNAKPTSREDREKQKEASGINKLWYESGDPEDVEKPRALVVGPSGQPVRPSSALRNAREPNDYMASPSNSLYQNRKLGASLGLDDMISNEIRQLQAQMEEQDRATNARMNLGSFDPTRSLDRSYEGGPTYRFNARDSRDSLPRRSASPSPTRRSAQQTRNNGLSDSTDEFLRKYQVGSFGADAWRDSIAAGGAGSGGGAYRGDISPLRLSGDIMRSSVETLGSTGIRGLLVPHLKLDGKKEEKPVVEEVVKSDAELAEMNRQLEELLKSMNANHPPRNEYFPEGVAESILQITNKVQADILDFKSLFGDKHQREDDEEKALKERDEKMKEEGRKQAREKQLLDLDLPASHPLEYFGVWDPAQQQHLPIMSNQRRLDYFPHPVSHATPQQLPQQQHQQNTSHLVSLSQAMVGTVQQQIDLSELRLSDDGSVGSPFPQYNSTILSPEASNNNNVSNNILKEGFAVGNTPVAGSAPEATAPVTPAPNTASATAAAAAPTLASAGLLSGAAPGVVPSAAVAAGGQMPIDRSQVRGFGPTAGLVQSALDSEIAAVDTAYHQIRALHHQLGNRMRHLDAIHSSVSIPSGPAGPTRVGGVVPVSAYQRSAQTHFLREGHGPGAGPHGGIPLYARPGGPPAHPHYQPQAAQSGYPAGLGPMAVADNHYAAPTRAYSALEEYYNSLAEEQLAATQDTRTLFNPFPELVHSNILGVNKGIQAALDVTMRTLHARLPEEVAKRSPPAPAVHPTLADATAAAAHTVLPVHPTPVAAPVSASAIAPKPSVEPALSSVVNKVASSLVGDVLDVSEYRKSAEGLLTRSFPPPSAPADPAHAPAVPVAPAPVATAAAVSTSTSGASAAATGLKSYLNKVTEVPQTSAPAVSSVAASVATPAGAAPASVKAENKAPSTGATALASVAPGKSSREVLAELDSVLGVDDKKSNYLARDLFVPTSTANTFPVVSHAPHSAQEKPFLHAADAYLQNHYGCNTYDPRMQYDPPAKKTNGPVLIQAPSDHELLHRHPQFAAQGGASAPPAAVEFAMARAPFQASPVPTSSRLYSQPAPSSSSAVPSAHVSEVHQANGYPAYPADPRRAVELANTQHLRRPVEGGATNFLFENRIGVLATEEGNKYVSPFAQSQEQIYTGNTGFNPQYTNRQVSPSARNNNNNHGVRGGYSESKGSPPDRAVSSAGKKIIHVPSPTSIAASHERQSYLAQMRQLRANLCAK